MNLRLRSLLLTLFAIVLTSANTFSQTATIATDALDYPPGSTAIITGAGFQPGETVTLQVLHYPTCCDDSTSASHQPWRVVADASGNVSSSWLVPGDQDELGATLQLTAVGTSGLTASEVFTDGAQTTTVISSGTNPSTYGNLVMFTITVSTTSSGSPTGTVVIKDAGNAISGNLNISSSGTGTNQSQATFSISTLSASTHSITASYTTNSSPNFNSSSSNAISQANPTASSMWRSAVATCRA